MGSLRTVVLFVFLLVPVSCKEGFFSDPVICYILDGFLIIYCIIATVLFYKAKFSYIPSVAVGVPNDNGAIYQELQIPSDSDPYQVLEPSKRKKRAAKKKKLEPSPAQDRGQEPHTPNAAARPLPSY